MLNLKPLRELMRTGAGGGLALMAAAAIALVVANSPLAGIYLATLDLPVVIQLGALVVDKPLLLWINDGLMAIFFLLVGLELKRELLHGELADMRKIMLPAAGAVGGMLVPALVYVSFNWGDPLALEGWAIPAATDIAFALAVLSLLGPRVPLSVKVFLVSLAIFDDVGAIIIIALFYTSDLSWQALMLALPCLALLALLNRRGVTHALPYILVGSLLWLAVLKSGVHATLAGVALAIFIPAGRNDSLLESWEHKLQTPVAFLILPLFAFANAGLPLAGIGWDDVMHPVTLGIGFGLLLGKQLGVLGFCWAAIRLGWAQRPSDMSWSALYGTAILSGIGFTMSLFIGSLAFESAGARAFDERLGILIGSLLSALMGYAVLRFIAFRHGRPLAALPSTPAEATNN